MKGNGTAGYLSALLTIIIWGTTFISTKILLVDFQPVEILFFRFVMGLLALLVVYPQPLKGTNRQQELTFAAAGLCGICLYYLLENIRIGKAKKLLEQGVPPVEAALQTGFSDQSHFTNYFNRFIGLAPGVYRDIFKGMEESTHEG